MSKITPVVLSGGSGTRLWPMSRAAMPKQLLPLISEQSMLQETITRLSGWSGMQAPVVVCGNDYRFLIAEQLREINIVPNAILLEPIGRNTAPAIAVAAHKVLKTNKNGLMLVLPADHIIRDVQAFEKAVALGVEAAEEGKLVTFGIQPDAPETGYGYIHRGKETKQAGVYKVAQFVEKPNLVKAQDYMDSGEYFWNSGMFIFKPEVYLAELEKFNPKIYSAAKKSFDALYEDLDFCRLEEKSFASSPSDSIDYAVMEKTELAAVVPVDIGWNDVGSWSALWDVEEKDAQGNAIKGDVFIEQTSNSLIRSESRFIAAIGVDNLVIVETPDAVLVANKDNAQEVKNIVDYLKKSSRTEHQFHPRVYRPWGWYEGIDIGERFQVKRIMVKPAEKLSLQMHHHRAEHWVVVSGTALVTRDDKVEIVTENQSVYIPIGTKHRLENPGKLPLHLIEVQSGGYLGEDDIVRMEDRYGRS